MVQDGARLQLKFDGEAEQSKHGNSLLSGEAVLQCILRWVVNKS